ncbi:MAG: hypothetical protein OEV94_01065 [Deltaproteobacteria bacterium]|nr:hypothetical protein [Deltaproteobacteria bacterium]
MARAQTPAAQPQAAQPLHVIPTTHWTRPGAEFGQKPTGKEKRRHTRVIYDPTNGPRVMVDDYQFPLVDVSEGGICFLSSIQWRRGQILEFNPLARTQMDLKILRAEKDKQGLMENFPYRVNAQFAQDVPKAMLNYMMQRFYDWKEKPE